jgi:non-specific serine/threonine protein kinase
VVTDGDALFVLGGRNAAKVSVADAYRIDPVDGNATRFSALEPPVHDAAGVFVQDAPMVIGGGAPPIQRIVQSLKPNGEIVPLAEMPAPRADHVAALIGDTTYVLGGGDDAATLIPEVIAFDGTAWRSVGTLAEPVRYPAVAVIDDAVYLFGGVSSSEGTDTASVQRYDPATGTTQVVAELPTPLSHASAVLLGGRVYVVGGYVNNVASAQVLAFDPSAGTFTPAGDLDAPRTDAGVVTIGDTGYLVGGESADGAVATVTLLRV